MAAASLLVLSASDVDKISASFLPLDLQGLMARVFVALSTSTSSSGSTSGSGSNSNSSSSSNSKASAQGQGPQGKEPQGQEPQGKAKAGSCPDVQAPHRTTISMQNHTALFMPARIRLPRLTADTVAGASRGEGEAGERRRGEGVSNLGSAGGGGTTAATATSAAATMTSAAATMTSAAATMTSTAATTTSTAATAASASTSVKIVCVPKKPDSARGLPATTVVLDEESGSVKAVVNARKLTALRNAAGSLLSTSLAATRYPRHIVAFGAGNQIEAHLDLHLRFFLGVKRCTIVNRTLNERARGLLRRLAPRFAHVEFALRSLHEEPPNRSAGKDEYRARETESMALLEQVVRSADLIVCATSATSPLFPSAWVRTGTHVVLVGSYRPEMQEVDSELILRAAASLGAEPPARRPSQILLVDSADACFREAGELIRAKVAVEGVVEIGDIVLRKAGGDVDMDRLRALLCAAEGSGGDAPIPYDDNANDNNEDVPDDAQFKGPVTIFKSVGVGLQDVAIACAVVEQAEQLGLGQRILDYDEE